MCVCVCVCAYCSFAILQGRISLAIGGSLVHCTFSQGEKKDVLETSLVYATLNSRNIAAGVFFLRNV